MVTKIFSKPGGKGIFISFLLLVGIWTSTDAQTTSCNSGPTSLWNSAATAWIGTGSYPWTYTPRVCYTCYYYNPGCQTPYAINDRMPGFMEYLPKDYTNPSNNLKKYPLIIYFPGCGEMGDGQIYKNASGCLRYDSGIGRIFATWGGFNAVATKVRDNGDYFSAIPVHKIGDPYSPIINTTGVIVMAMMPFNPSNTDPCGNATAFIRPGPQDINDIINKAVQLYRVDPTRIYLTGMSAGGEVCWTYPGTSVANAKRIAASAPVCSVHDGSDPIWSANAVAGNLHVMALVNICDQTTIGANRYLNNKNLIDQMNALSPQVNPLNNLGIGVYFTDNFNGTTCSANVHDAWSKAYSTFTPVFNDGVRTYNLYEWFLTQQNLNLLPVTLKEFEASKKNNTVVLSWVTGTEQNSSFFTVERSPDGIHFSEIGRVDAAGNSSVDRQYNFTDADLPSGDYLYYRLKQTDIDGKVQIYGVRRVFTGSQGFAMKAYPTPTSSMLNVELQGTRNEKITLRVVDVSGKLLLEQVVPARQNRVDLNVSRLSSGVYILHASSESFQQVSRFVKQ